MPHHQRCREQQFQFADKPPQTVPLQQRAGVFGKSAGIQPAFVADAHAVRVVIEAMRPRLFHRASPVDVAVAGDVEMITYIQEPPVTDMVAPTLFKIKALPLTGGRAMNDNKCNSPHRLMQELIPNTPARVVATATITLSTMLQTDFFSVDIIIKF